MIEKCESCINKNSTLFGNCPIFSKIDQAQRLLADVQIDISVAFNCKNFQPIPVLAAVTAIVFRNGKFLLGKRRGSHGNGTWGLPGGKIDFGENWFNATQREVLEETGLQTGNFKFHGLTNDVFSDDKKHFVNIIVSCNPVDNNEARVTEPTKCECWEWVDIQKIVGTTITDYSPLFLSMTNILKTFDILKICNTFTN